MALSDLVTDTIGQIKERFPIGELEKFKNTRLSEKRTGGTELNAALFRHNTAIITAVSALMFVFSIVMLVFDGGAGGCAIAGDFIFLLNAAAGIAFSVYFKNRYPQYFIYAFWGAFLLGYMIKLISFAGNGDFFLTLSVTAAVGLLPIMSPAKLALFCAIPPVYHIIIALITNTVSPNNLWSFVSAAAIIAEGSCVYMLMCLRTADRCKMKNEEQRVKLTQKMDRTTGLFNRTYGIEQTDYALTHGMSVAVILVDIDNFSKYNRLYGVDASDGVLDRICRCVKVIAKPKTDKICRFSGDTILILIPTISDREPVALAEEIRKAVRTMSIPFPENNGYGTVTVTASVARNEAGDTCASLCERAEASLKKAKSEGRNCVGFKNHAFRSEPVPEEAMNPMPKKAAKPAAAKSALQSVPDTAPISEPSASDKAAKSSAPEVKTAAAPVQEETAKPENKPSAPEEKADDNTLPNTTIPADHAKPLVATSVTTNTMTGVSPLVSTVPTKTGQLPDVEKAPQKAEKAAAPEAESSVENSFEKALAEASAKNKVVDTIVEDVLG